MPVNPVAGRRLTSISGFMNRLFDRTDRESGRILAFRGHESEDYTLTPSIFRNKTNKKSEKRLVQELISSAPGEFVEDKSTFDRLVRMQHFALPTRLLDCTLNPLVALYFATGSGAPRGHSKTGEVVIFSVPDDDVRYYDSDSVSCLANMAYLTEDEKHGLPDSSLDIKKFNQNDSVDRLVQFVRAEKPGFRNIIDPFELENVYFTVPKDLNKRIIAQSGRFFTFGRTECIDDGLVGMEIDRIKIDAGSKEKIRDQLDQLSINGRTLFPEIESAARYIKDSFS